MKAVQILQRRQVDEEIYRLAGRIKTAYRGIKEGRKIYAPKALEALDRHKKRLYRLLGEDLTSSQREDVQGLIEDVEELIHHIENLMEEDFHRNMGEAIARSEP